MRFSVYLRVSLTLSSSMFRTQWNLTIYWKNGFLFHSLPKRIHVINFRNDQGKSHSPLIPTYYNDNLAPIYFYSLGASNETLLLLLLYASLCGVFFLYKKLDFFINFPCADFWIEVEMVQLHFASSFPFSCIDVCVSVCDVFAWIRESSFE